MMKQQHEVTPFITFEILTQIIWRCWLSEWKMWMEQFGKQNVKGKKREITAIPEGLIKHDKIVH